jgi:hypothetical protein
MAQLQAKLAQSSNTQPILANALVHFEIPALSQGGDEMFDEFVRMKRAEESKKKPLDKIPSRIF